MPIESPAGKSANLNHEYFKLPFDATTARKFKPGEPLHITKKVIPYVNGDLDRFSVTCGVKPGLICPPKVPPRIEIHVKKMEVDLFEVRWRYTAKDGEAEKEWSPVIEMNFEQLRLVLPRNLTSLKIL